MGGLVGPRAIMDDKEKRKFFTLKEFKIEFFGHQNRSQSLYV
jgi:hypothetical protein